MAPSGIAHAMSDGVNIRPKEAGHMQKLMLNAFSMNFSRSRGKPFT